MAAPVSNIPVSVDYTSRDYYSIRNELITRLATTLPNWSGSDPADFGLALVEAFAYMGDVINYYIDRIANEAYIFTATQRQSILNIARIYGYIPSSYVSATTTVQFKNTSTTSAQTIPAGTQIQGTVKYNDTVQQVIFETNEDVTIAIAADSATPSYAEVTATHGETVSVRPENKGAVAYPADVDGVLIGTSNGLPEQSFFLRENQIVQNSVVIYVQKGDVYQKWTQVVHLADYGPNDAVYTVATDANNFVYVNFGDGVSGAIPPNQKSIKADYRIGGGLVGNITTGILDVMYRIPDGTSASVAFPTVSVNANSVGTGGVNPESNDSIRRRAPKALSALNRAVTLDDFTNLASSVSTVGKANATADVWNSVTLYISEHQEDTSAELYPSYISGTYDPETQLGTVKPTWTDSQTEVLAYLANKTQIGVTVKVFPPTYVPLSVSVQFNNLPEYSVTQVSENIQKAFATSFSYNFNDFAAVVSPEEIEFKLRQVEGVSTARVTQLYKTGGTVARGVVIAGAGEIFVYDTANITISALSDDPTLSAQVVKDGTTDATIGTWSPAYSSTFYNYSVVLPTGTTSIKLTPTATVPTSSSGGVVSIYGTTIYVNGTAVASGAASTAITTNVGTTTVTVNTIAGNGVTAATYTLTLTRTS